MSAKTRAELTAQNDNLIKLNGNEEITGTILNGHLKDFIDSFKIDTGSTGGGVILYSKTITTPTIISTNTGVTISNTPLYQVTVRINGISHQIGINANNKFYFKDPTGTIVRNYNEIMVGDYLHYNSTALGYTLDSNDEITITYITST